MPSINLLLKPSSGMCNMKCSYCFYQDEMKKRETETFGFMTEETLENIIIRAFAFADCECSFAYQGGEPTLIGLDFYKKALDLQKKHNKKGIKVNNALQTNGILLNEDWCKFLAEQDFLTGISVDGIRRTHDINRKGSSGEDTYLICMNSIELLKQYGADYNILTVVNKDTAVKINKIYQSYQKKGFLYQQYIACLDPLFEEAGKMVYSLTPKLYGEFLCELFGMWSDDLQRKKQPYIRQFENYIGILLGKQPESCAQNGVCGRQYVVEADGSTYPCDFYMLEKFKLGNLNENSLEDLNRRRKQIGFIEQSANQSAACKACKYFVLCRGGCRRERIPEPDGKGQRNYFCESYHMLFDRHYDTMNKIAKAIRFGGY